VADPTSCVFCDILAGKAPATVVRSWSTAIAIKPLDPVTEGHTLIIPATHVRDVSEDPEVSAMTMEAAAEYAAGVGPCNVITSVGREATQTVFHLHIHVVPRRDGDGLALPWTPHASQERAEKAECEVADLATTLARGTLEPPQELLDEEETRRHVEP
jgi:histidine triad (HIT) family protein